ncbi:MAG TPA: flavin reductase family protein, partial [Chloroflexota bacterium]
MGANGAALPTHGLDAAAFKHAARRFASGVTVVTTSVDETLHGGTVSAFFTLSLDPLQVLISLNRSGRLAGLILQSGCFAVNVLAVEQEPLARLFASPERPVAQRAFPGIATDPAATGAPVIRGCLAYFDCRVAQTIDSGDHTLFVGLVQAVGDSDGLPLIYFDGAYRLLTA